MNQLFVEKIRHLPKPLEPYVRVLCGDTVNPFDESMGEISEVWEFLRGELALRPRKLDVTTWRHFQSFLRKMGERAGPEHLRHYETYLYIYRHNSDDVKVHDGAWCHDECAYTDVVPELRNIGTLFTSNSTQFIQLRLWVERESNAPRNITEPTIRWIIFYTLLVTSPFYVEEPLTLIEMLTWDDVVCDGKYPGIRREAEGCRVWTHPLCQSSALLLRKIRLISDVKDRSKPVFALPQKAHLRKMISDFWRANAHVTIAPGSEFRRFECAGQLCYCAVTSSPVLQTAGMRRFWGVYTSTESHDAFLTGGTPRLTGPEGKRGREIRSLPGATVEARMESNRAQNMFSADVDFFKKSHLRLLNWSKMTKGECAAAKARYLPELERRCSDASEGVPSWLYCLLFYAYEGLSSKSQGRTRGMVIGRLRSWVISICSTALPREVSQHKLEELVAAISGTYANQELGMVMAFLRFLKDRDLLNPESDLARLRAFAKRSHAEKEHGTQLEVRELLGWREAQAVWEDPAMDDLLRGFFALMYGAALRQREVYRLTSDDLMWIGGKLVIRIPRVKTGSSIRDVELEKMLPLPMYQWIVQYALRRLASCSRMRQKQWFIQRHTDDTRPLRHPRPHDEDVEIKGLLVPLVKIMRRITGRHITCHDLRRTCVNHLIIRFWELGIKPNRQTIQDGEDEAAVNWSPIPFATVHLLFGITLTRAQAAEVAMGHVFPQAKHIIGHAGILTLIRHYFQMWLPVAHQIYQHATPDERRPWAIGKANRR